MELLHELLVGDDPARRYRRKRTKATIGTKTRTAIAVNGEARQVSIAELVIHAKEIAQRDRRFAHGAGLKCLVYKSSLRRIYQVTVGKVLAIHGFKTGIGF